MIHGHGSAGAVTRHVTRSGLRIYRMPVETFPGHVNNIYLVRDGDLTTLIDAGSGLPDSNAGLEQRLAEVRERFGEPVSLEAVQHLVVTHAHIDHFGGTGHVAKRSGAMVWVHELDARVLTAFEERVVLASKDLRVFLERAGVKAETRAVLEQMYRFSKSLFVSVAVDRRVRHRDEVVNGYRVYHVPGHCPGQICLQVDDVLFSADHVLARITPHQSPAAITPFCGLELYLNSLERIRALEGITLTLPAHEAPVEDLRGRIDEIAAHHRGRLDRVLELCREPLSIAEVSKRLFGQTDGYTRILALEEAGAHVEYLFQRGELCIANLEDVEREPNPVIRYERRAAA